jgi:hypothetical protein
MPASVSPSRSPSAATIAAPTATRATCAAGLVVWLVLSGDRSTRDVVLGTLHRNGQDGHAATARSASAIAVATRGYRCAFIDLVHPGGRMTDLDHWTASLRLHEVRLVVRGGDDDLDDELWARDAGAAVYLPGSLAKDRLGCVLDQVSR